MNKLKIIICDLDEDYIHAFINYLIEKNGQIFSVTSYTKCETYQHHTGEYDVAILGKEFLEISNENVKIQYPIYLCEDRIEVQYQHMTYISKYQSMNKTIEFLMEFHRIIMAQEEPPESSIERTIIGIYSPITHELQMPYALTLAKILAERESVLFVDLEDVSLVQEFVETDEQMDLYDLFYLMEGEDIRNIELEQFIIHQENLDILPGFQSPEELSMISSEQWKDLFSIIKKNHYETVVLLFGRILPGFSELLHQCKQILLINKPGEYYEKSQWRIWEFLDRERLKQQAKDVSLPMSAMNLAVGSYLIEELRQGNMGRFIRRQISAGEINGA